MNRVLAMKRNSVPNYVNEPRIRSAKKKSKYAKKFLGKLIIVIPGILK